MLRATAKQQLASTNLQPTNLLFNHNTVNSDTSETGLWQCIKNLQSGLCTPRHTVNTWVTWKSLRAEVIASKKKKTHMLKSMHHQLTGFPALPPCTHFYSCRNTNVRRIEDVKKRGGGDNNKRWARRVPQQPQQGYYLNQVSVLNIISGDEVILFNHHQNKHLHTKV